MAYAIKNVCFGKVLYMTKYAIHANLSLMKIKDESVPATFVRVLFSPYLRQTGLRCIASIINNFFIKQYKAAFFAGSVPVSSVDHPLDEKIPFYPGKVKIYLDFVAFWVRTIGFLLKNCKRRAYKCVKEFIRSMGELYAFAATVYGRNFSTTNRPFYIKNPRFLLIHMVDPHLMCVPSLHAMVVILTYTSFRKMIKELGEEDRFKEQLDELYQGAIAITEAILYVKQHSVNCVPAALYAMTCFNPELFPIEEGVSFTYNLFNSVKKPEKEEVKNIHEHIISHYNRFLSEKEAGEKDFDWKTPLLNFLKDYNTRLLPVK